MFRIQFLVPVCERTLFFFFLNFSHDLAITFCAVPPDRQAALGWDPAQTYSKAGAVRGVPAGSLAAPQSVQPPYLTGTSPVVIVPFLLGGRWQPRGEQGVGSLREAKQCEELSPTNILGMTTNFYRNSCGPEQITLQGRPTAIKSSFQHLVDIFLGPRVLSQVTKA